MKELTISTDQARQFALEVYDKLIQDIKAGQENDQQGKPNKDYSTERLVA